VSETKSEAQPPKPAAAPADFPLAKALDPPRGVRGLFRRYGTSWWALTALAAVLAIFLSVRSGRGDGPRIRVSFRDAQGLKPGDALRYLGSEVGRVESVALNESLLGVEVRLVLHPQAAGLARKGSRFWIERPRVSLSRISGLETVVGAKYVGVVPGPDGSSPEIAFQGLEVPPTIGAVASVEIVVRLKDGRGLAVGDVLKHRGIAVGEVTSVGLDESASLVIANVELVETARRLARAGSRFWVQEPQVNWSGVQGLDTLVGARYLAVDPGPEGAPELLVFDGLERPPAAPERAEGGLEVILDASHRSGLDAGSPVTYRGIVVGHLASVGLSSDAVRVEARAYIRAEYRELVRENSRFWSTSGLAVSMGWAGVRMGFDSLASLTAGGVALGTPDPPGRPVATGHRFPLEAQPDAVWSEWQPRLPLGTALLPDGLVPPRPQRATLSWKERSYGFTRKRQHEGWAILLEGKRLLGPAELFHPVEGALDGQCLLALAGQEGQLAAAGVRVAGRLAVYSVEPGAAQSPETDAASPWPLARLRAGAEPEDCLLVGDPQGPLVPVAAGRMAVREGGWDLDPAIPLDSSWHGAGTVARRDGALVGILLMDRGRASVAPVPVAILKN